MAMAGGLPGARVRGYIKSFALAFTLPDNLSAIESNPPLGLVTNRLRLTFSTSVSSKIGFEAAWDLSPRYSEVFLDGIFPTATGGDSGLDYRAGDFKSRLVTPAGDPTSGFALHHNLDRMLVTIKFSGADLFIGRQAIAWGSARTINPTDIIAPFTFNELDTEDRRGVDALRLRVPLGMMDELDIGWVAGHNFSLHRSAFFLRGKFHVLQTDVAWLAMAFRRHFLAGLDLAGSIGGAGAWLEAAWVKPLAFAPTEPGDRTAYFRLSAGMDYNFSGRLYAFGEYHFNSAGRHNPDSYPDILESPAIKDGAVYLMGRHYFSAGATWQVTPLLPFTLLIIWNLSDGSLTLAPSAEYNVAENFYLAAGAYLGRGDPPGMGSTGPVMRSEFGTWPHMFYTALRYYF